jgi:hypothetical protein
VFIFQIRSARKKQMSSIIFIGDVPQLEQNLIEHVHGTGQDGVIESVNWRVIIKPVGLRRIATVASIRNFKIY